MNDALNTFLCYGNLIDTEAGIAHLQQIAPLLRTSKHTPALDTATDTWEAAFAHADPSATHVIPLTGGLDSRAILGALLKIVPRHRIHAFTYGTPGIWDMRIAKALCKQVGVAHTAVDLNTCSVSQEKWLRLAQDTVYFLPLSHLYYNHLVFKHFGSGAVYWLGHGGDAISGMHLNAHKVPTTWEVARQKFVKHNHFPHDRLSHPDYDPVKYLPAAPILPPEHMTYSDQLDIGFRQEQHLRQLLIPTDANYQVELPFIAVPWLELMLNVPMQVRSQRQFYIRLLQHAYPRLMAFPTTMNFGLPPTVTGARRAWQRQRLKLGRRLNQYLPLGWQQPAPGKKYPNLRQQLKRDKKLQALYTMVLGNLGQKQLVNWLDIDNIWRQFFVSNAPLELDVQLLFSLSIYTQAGRTL